MMAGTLLFGVMERQKYKKRDRNTMERTCAIEGCSGKLHARGISERVYPWKSIKNKRF